MKKMNFTKLGTLALLLVALLVVGIQKIDAKSYNQRFPKETLADRIQKLDELSNTPISFDAIQAQKVIVPELTDENYSLAEVLEKTLENTGYSYQLKNGSYIIYKDDINTPKNKAQNGKVRGTVLDENGKFLPGANVSTVDGKQGTVTNDEGKFSLELPGGTYTLEVSYIGYQPYQITDVKVRNGKSTPLDIKLENLSNELSEVIVTAHYNKASAKGLYARQKAIASMSDGVSADLIKKTSDNNVAQVLNRVSSVTIDRGKYVIVRGMGDRYNNVQLNGASMPSTEPNRRNFSFNIIPSSMVDNVTIAKTFTPDLPGEFTGGLVQINTLAIPQEKIIKLSAGVGYNTLATGEKFLSNKRFDADYFLGEIDDRNWYAGHSDEEMDQSYKNIIQKNTWGLREYTAMPTQSYSLTLGKPFHVGNSKLGIIAALNYRHSENREEIEEGRFFKSDTIAKTSNRYIFETAVGASLNAGWEATNHKITLRNLFNNRFTHKNHELYTNNYYSGDFYEYEQYYAPLRNQIIQTQIDGVHDLLHRKLKVTWNASYNKTERTNPDDRLVKGDVRDSLNTDQPIIEWSSSVRGDGYTNVSDNSVMYSNLEETKKNLGIDVEFPFEVQGNVQKLKVGYAGAFREADFVHHYVIARKYKNIALGDSIIYASVDRFFASENFGEDKLYLRTSEIDGNKPSFYIGEKNINAAYAMGEFSFFKKLRIIAGARWEQNETETVTRKWKTLENREGVWKDTTYVSDKTDILPAATLIYSLTPDVNIRAAFSKTLARPDFRELTITQYYNVDDRTTIKNIVPVEQTETYNYDVKMEWFPHPGEILSVGLFYKDFHHPVEQIIHQGIDQQHYDKYFVNLESSEAKGIELNWRKSLGFLYPSSKFLKNLYLTGNFSWLDSKVTYNRMVVQASKEYKDLKTEEEKKNYLEKYKDYNRDRPLQGQSPYTINAGLSYQGECYGASVNYNRQGRTLLFAGEFKYDDMYLKPRDVLDIQISARFLQKRLELKFNASDILQQDFISYRNQGKYVGYTSPDKDIPEVKLDLTDDMDYNEYDIVSNRSHKGVNLSLTATYTF